MSKGKFKHFILLAAALACFIGLVGCNTLKGAGKDLESAGEALEDAAD